MSEKLGGKKYFEAGRCSSYSEFGFRKQRPVHCSRHEHTESRSSGQSRDHCARFDIIARLERVIPTITELGYVSPQADRDDRQSPVKDEIPPHLHDSMRIPIIPS